MVNEKFSYRYYVNTIVDLVIEVKGMRADLFMFDKDLKVCTYPKEYGCRLLVNGGMQFVFVEQSNSAEFRVTMNSKDRARYTFIGTKDFEKFIREIATHKEKIE